MSEPKGYARIYAVVKRIPIGRVATYGQVAELAGIPGHARQVGYALNALPDDHEVPWHRVINSQGRISLRADSGYDDLQRTMLEAEGIEFDTSDRIALEKYRWHTER